MKIGILLPSIERWSSHYGGACARTVHELIEQPNFKDDEVMVFCQTSDSKHKYPGQNSAPFFSKFWNFLNIKVGKISMSFDGWFWLLPQFYKLRKYELIHIHNRPHYALILRKLGYKGKIIVHLHNDFAKASASFVKEFVDASDKVISCSQKIADRLFIKVPSNQHKSIVLNNAVDHRKFTFTPFEDRKKSILFVGRIDEIKGVHNLIAAYEKLIKIDPEWELNLAGSASFGGHRQLSEYEIQIQKRINEVNNEGGRITHLGYINHNQLPALYQSNQIFCLPSVVHEAFPLVILEAMFSGTPIVASDMGGISEATGPHALLAEPTEIELTNKLIWAISHPEILERNSLEAYKRAISLFTKEKIANQQYEIYQQLLHE